MRKQFESAVNVFLIFTCAVLLILVLRDRVFGGRSSDKRSATTAVGEAAPIVLPALQPLGDLGPRVTLAARPTKGDPAVGLLDGGVITASELERLAAAEMVGVRAQEYTARHTALSRGLERLLLEREAEIQGMSIESLASLEISMKAAPTRESDVDEELSASKRRFAGLPVEQARKLATNAVAQRNLGVRRREFFNQLRQKYNAKLLLEPLRFKVDSRGRLAHGPTDALVTIVEFADFQCPYCARLEETLREIEAQYGARLRIVFKHFPLPIHANAELGAEAAECAADQGVFRQMRDAMFAKQSFSREDLRVAAQRNGADVALFESCLRSEAYRGTWQTDKKTGEFLGVSSTPTLFINGRIVVGAVTREDLSAIIDDELTRASGRK